MLFRSGLVNLWYGGQKRLKAVSIGQVWRPAGSPAAGLDLSADSSAGLPADEAVAAPAKAAVAPPPIKR